MVSVSWFGHGSIDWPAKLYNATMQCGLIDAELSSPDRERLGLTAIGNQASPASVTVLDRSERPAYITRLIAPIIVDAVDAVGLGGPLPDVCQEGIERVPLGTYLDPSASIARILLRLRIAATLTHRYPRPVFGDASDIPSRLLHANDYTMSGTG
jgi:hypothetical protein